MHIHFLSVLFTFGSFSDGKILLLTKTFYRLFLSVNNFMVITCTFEVTRAKNCPIIFELNTLLGFKCLVFTFYYHAQN